MRLRLLRKIKMAEKEGFEPSRQSPQPTPLAGEPLRPLGYFSIGLHASMKVAEREGFEPPDPEGPTDFKSVPFNLAPAYFLDISFYVF